MQNHIILFGAGKSATVLIDYLKNLCDQENWQATVIDFDKKIVEDKVGSHALVKALQMDIAKDELNRKQVIADASIVISLLPPSLHYTIALDCLALNKNLLTASYIDENIKKHAHEIKSKGLLFLYEMGLDPGIDHMSAMQLIDELKNSGATITSFKSHCGGLVAPESNDNPWGYKISWNPRNVVMAGSAGAVYKEYGEIVNLESAQDVFADEESLTISSNEEYGFYPNRDSISYMETYGLQHVETFKRTTLRHVNFISGWYVVLRFKLTDTHHVYDTTSMSLAAFFESHFEKHQISIWQELIDYLPGEIKEQILSLGIYDKKTLINKGNCTAADVLQSIIEKNWALQPNDKDMVVMAHEIEYIYQKQKKKITSFLKVIGENSKHTAMAKTVGLPLGIAAKLILTNILQDTGLQLPTKPIYYSLILEELQKFGITFIEKGVEF